jgi:beta-lactamase regulating signal transducer with metallopeptidase domain
MDTGLRLLLTNAALAALVASMALLVSRLVRRPALAHAFWLLALVKLVTPPILSLPLLPTWSSPTAVSSAPAAASRDAMPADVPETRDAPLVLRTSVPAATQGPIRPAPRVAAAESLPFALEPPAPVNPAGDRAAGVRAALGAVLAFGAISVLVLAAVRFARFRAVLEWAEPASEPLRARADALAADLGLRRAPPVLIVPARIPPMLWPEPGGPRLLLPQALLAELTEAETDALLAHELAHVRRRDHWVRLVELAATSLFWWYPVTWCTRAALRRSEERCCDEWVLRVLPDSAEAYAQGLLKSLTFVSSSPLPLPALASGASPLYELELRLKEILMSRPAPRLASPVRMALLAVAALGLAVYPTHAREDVAPAPPRPPAAPASPKPAAPATAKPAPPRVAPAPALPVAAPRPSAASRPPEAVPPAAPPEGAAPEAAPPVPAASPVVVSVSPAPALPAAPPLAQTTMTPPPSAPAPAARPALAPPPARPAPAPAPLPPAPAVQSARSKAARRAIEEHQRAVEAQRQRLQQKEMEIERQKIELRARMEESELRATADRARAEGRKQETELLEKQIEFAKQRALLDRQRLELDAVRLELEARQSLEERRLAEKIEALESHSVAESTEELAHSIERRAEELEASVRESGGAPEVEREIQKLKAALDALRSGETKQP